MVNYVSKFSNNNTEYTLKDSNAVHKTGDEAIAGAKTFTGNIVKKIEATVDGANHYSTPLVFKDSNDTVTGYIRNVYYSNNAIVTGLQTPRTIDGVIKYASIEVGIKEDGTIFTFAPTPAMSDNSTNIATTAFVNNKLQVVSELPANPDPNVFYYVVG